MVKLIKTIFCVLVGIFVMILGWMVFPDFVLAKQMLFPFGVVLVVVFFLLGLVLMFLTIKGKVKSKLKKFLILTGGSASGFLVGVLLHNLLYGLGMLVEHVAWLYFLLEVLHVGFFIMAVLVCPLGFLIHVVGSVVMFSKKKK